MLEVLDRELGLGGARPELRVGLSGLREERFEGLPLPRVERGDGQELAEGRGRPGGLLLESLRVREGFVALALRGDGVGVERDDARGRRPREHILDGLAADLREGPHGGGKARAVEGIERLGRHAHRLARPRGERAEREQARVPPGLHAQDREVLPVALLLRVGEPVGITERRGHVGPEALVLRGGGLHGVGRHERRELVLARVESERTERDLFAVRVDRAHLHVRPVAHRAVGERVVPPRVGRRLAHALGRAAEALAVRPQRHAVGLGSAREPELAFDARGALSGVLQRGERLFIGLAAHRELATRLKLRDGVARARAEHLLFELVFGHVQPDRAELLLERADLVAARAQPGLRVALRQRGELREEGVFGGGFVGFAHHRGSTFFKRLVELDSLAGVVDNGLSTASGPRFMSGPPVTSAELLEERRPRRLEGVQQRLAEYTQAVFLEVGQDARTKVGREEAGVVRASVIVREITSRQDRATPRTAVHLVVHQPGIERDHVGEVREDEPRLARPGARFESAQRLRGEVRFAVAPLGLSVH